MSAAGTDDCPFCDIVAGLAPASIVYANNQVLAFMDIQPVTSGHCLVIPKNHIPDLEELPDGLGMELFRVAHRLARALGRSHLHCEGVNMFLADGEAAFQEVFHTHLHVFPRFSEDNFRIAADWRIRDRDELDTAAVQLRRGLAALGSG